MITHTGVPVALAAGLIRGISMEWQALDGQAMYQSPQHWLDTVRTRMADHETPGVLRYVLVRWRVTDRRLPPDRIVLEHVETLGLYKVGAYGWDASWEHWADTMPSLASGERPPNLETPPGFERALRWLRQNVDPSTDGPYPYAKPGDDLTWWWLRRRAPQRMDEVQPQHVLRLQGMGERHWNGRTTEADRLVVARGCWDLLNG